MPQTNRDRLLLLSRILWGLSFVILVIRIIIVRSIPYWAQEPYDPAHPIPVDHGIRTFHVAPFIGFCVNYGYVFYLFFFAALGFAVFAASKSRAPRPGGAANLS